MEITIGMKGEVATDVEKVDTALEVGSGSLLVYATPCMVALMEGAACEAIEAALPETAVRITFERLSETRRKITVLGVAL